MASVVISGDTSGTVTLAAPAVAGSTTITLPATTGTAALTTQVPAVLLTSTNYATTSGTTVDATGIPSGVKRITVLFSGLSGNGSSNYLIQLGTSGGIDSTGYVSSAAAITGTNTTTTVNSTAGWIFQNPGTIATVDGIMTIANVSGNIWVSSFVGRNNSNHVLFSSGINTFDATVDRLRLTHANGTDAFDAGSMTVMYEG